VTLRIAHCSDLHMTSSPLAERWTQLFGKRAAGLASYYVGGRRRGFAGVADRIATLLDDVDRARVDHVLCTGDLTSMSYTAEFERCAALFGARLEQPQRFTVLPGNHDRYTPEARRARAFERWFGGVSSPNGRWPFRKDVSDQLTIVGVDVCRPTSLVDSSGYCGPEQLNRLVEMLSAPELSQRTVVVALHYALLLADGTPDHAIHGVRDWRALLSALEAPSARVDLVVHGHVHEPYVVQRDRFAMVCVGSATDLRRGGGYNIYAIDSSGNIDLERRDWSPTTNAFVLRDTVPLRRV